MCSICGELNFSEPIDCNLTHRMNDTMKHRGPDESNLFFDSFSSLGHNRLAVIDVENGHQPMSVFYGNKKYTIVVIDGIR